MNHLPQQGYEEITAGVSVSFSVAALENIVLVQTNLISQSPYVFTQTVLTNQILSFVRLNYKFSLRTSAKAPNKKTNLYSQRGSAVSGRCYGVEIVKRNPFNLTQV